MRLSSVLRALPLLVPTLLAAALAGCGDDRSSASPAPLAGTSWNLDTEALGIAGAGGVSSFLTFTQADVNGSDGCNGFGGPYTANGDSLSLGPLASTQKACIGPADEVSRLVGPRLEQVASYSISGSTLTLKDAGFRTLLTYTAAPAGLEGAWKAVSVLYDDAIRGVLDGTTLTADFAADGTVSGSGGCNSFSGPYTIDGDQIRLGPLSATERACVTPEGANEQEAGYFAALDSARRFEQRGQDLVLLDEQSRMAVTLRR